MTPPQDSVIGCCCSSKWKCLNFYFICFYLINWAVYWLTPIYFAFIISILNIHSIIGRFHLLFSFSDVCILLCTSVSPRERFLLTSESKLSLSPFFRFSWQADHQKKRSARSVGRPRPPAVELQRHQPLLRTACNCLIVIKVLANYYWYTNSETQQREPVHWPHQPKLVFRRRLCYLLAPAGKLPTFLLCSEYWSFENSCQS